MGNNGFKCKYVMASNASSNRSEFLGFRFDYLTLQLRKWKVKWFQNFGDVAVSFVKNWNKIYHHTINSCLICAFNTVYCIGTIKIDSFCCPFATMFWGCSPVHCGCLIGSPGCVSCQGSASAGLRLLKWFGKWNIIYGQTNPFDTPYRTGQALK